MVQKIRLCRTAEEVDRNMSYGKRAVILVQASRESKRGGREEGDVDDKFLVTKEGLESLIGAGAQIIDLNSQDCSGVYGSRVIYSNRTFLHCSGKKPAAYSVESNLIG